MSRYISETLRAEVELRANGLCEYCRIRIEDTYFGVNEMAKIEPLTEIGEVILSCVKK